MMRPNEGIRRQQRRLFWGEVLSFAVLFFTLGAVVFFLYQNSVYRGVDNALIRQEKLLQSSPGTPPGPLTPNRRPSGQNGAPFRTNLVVFDASGEIVNATDLGDRYYAYFQNLHLDKGSVGKEQTLTTSGGVFRTLLVKVSKDTLNPLYAGNYVLILQNVDAQLDGINSFLRVLVVTMIIFWLLALLFASFLSRRSMRPIIRSWQRQQDFVADAAHELRAPLAVIQSQQEHLLTKPRDTVMAQSEAIATTLAEATRLEHLTNDLLTMAKADSNALTTDLQAHNIKAWAASVLTPYPEIASAQQRAFDSTLNAAGEAIFDADQLHQLLVILLDNGFKYTSAGDSIWVVLDREKNTWTIKVGNSGPSIPDADKVRIFDRFYRVDPSRNRDTGGSGLGLAIAHWIVQNHQGKMTVSDIHPQGVQFTVVLPLRPKK
ncbi:MAG: HAMP domain-containing sensor histidine kinase [Schleiferilactobacillus perolens]|uniref:sensor histidine kinase n=1 Tax=Schleiferilactobacillus perolens TaxID=100468 RepID=UPI0039EA741C